MVVIIVATVVVVGVLLSVSGFVRILLLEHVAPRNPLLAKLTDLLTRLTRRLFGFALNRPTEENVRQAGLVIEMISVGNLA